MNNAIKNALIFSLGAATGSLVAWRLLKTKYERITQEEINSYKEYVRAKNTQTAIEGEGEEDTDEITEEVVEELTESGIPKDILDRYRSTEYEREDCKPVKEPYVIPPEEYGMCPGYECTSLTYYADGVLTDEWDNVIESPDDIVGEDFASHYGEYEDDCVFIRNDEEKRDYEILRDLSSFSDTFTPADDSDMEE